MTRDTAADIRQAAAKRILVLDGQHDDLPEQAFYMVGPIEGAVDRAKQMAGAAT